MIFVHEDVFCNFRVLPPCLVRGNRAPRLPLIEAPSIDRDFRVLVGRLVLDGVVPAAASAAGAPALLVVSGRVSFEIVQKAAAAGIGAVAAVSAPTSLAVDLAEQSGVLLAGFVRDGSLRLYAHPERVVHDGA